MKMKTRGQKGYLSLRGKLSKERGPIGIRRGKKRSFVVEEGRKNGKKTLQKGGGSAHGQI